MARDKVDRTNDPGESEFAGDPDDPRVGIVPGYQVDGRPAKPIRALLDAYWLNESDPASVPDPEGSNIGDTEARERKTTEIVRQNQFRTFGPTYGRDIEP